MSKVLKHKQEIIEVLRKDKNLFEDAFGHFKTTDKKMRLKVGSTSLRCENKGEKWIKAWSSYYKDIEIKDGKLDVKKLIR